MKKLLFYVGAAIGLLYVGRCYLSLYSSLSGRTDLAVSKSEKVNSKCVCTVMVNTCYLAPYGSFKTIAYVTGVCVFCLICAILTLICIMVMKSKRQSMNAGLFHFHFLFILRNFCTVGLYSIFAGIVNN